MMKRVAQAGLALATITALAGASAADAQTAAYSFATQPVATSSVGTTQVRNQPTNPVDPFGGSIGFTFLVGAGGVTVTSLGYLDINGSGTLNDSHIVNLYSYVTTGGASVGTLLATTTITPSTTQTTDANGNLFAYQSIGTPVFLAPTGAASGITGYEIMADLTQSTASHAGDAFVDKMTGSSATFASPITFGTGGPGNIFGGSHYSTSPGGVFSTTSVNQDAGYFGPNFQIAAAPEPSEMAAFGLGIVGLGGLVFASRRRRLPQG